MRTRLLLTVILLAGVAAAASPLSPQPDRSLAAAGYQLSIGDDGRLSLADADGKPLLSGMTSVARFADHRGRTRVVAASGRAERSFVREEVDTVHGRALSLVVRTEKPRMPVLVQTFRLYPGRPFLTIDLTLEDVPASFSPWRLQSLEPLRAERNGGLDLGPDASRLVVLDNGSNLYLDIMTSLHPIGRPPMPAALFGSDSRSNWSSVVYDPVTGRSALAGFIGATETLDLVTVGGPSGGRLTHFGASCVERPSRPVAPGESIAADTLLLDLVSANPFDALEGYADALARALGVKPWPGPVPSGWNSWGEYYQDIDEKIILDNLDFAATNFAPYGMKYYQLDSGYYPAWGDWEADPIKFPHGMKWVADRIKERGMVPGIWIGPFCADVKSKVFQDHPDWFLPRKGFIPRAMVDEDLRVLDLTRPEVIDHLRAVTRRIVREWGYGWLKVDFAYYFMYYSRIPDSDASMAGAYRAALRAIREEAGPETFIVGIGPTGVHYGLFDAERITLDNMPVYNNHPSQFTLNPRIERAGFLQGLVPTVRTVARRYYLSHRVWVNHPDMFFFDNDRWPDWGDAPLTFEQARQFASVVGLTGGIVKLGDRLVDMKPREVEVVRKLLPVYPRTGRPLDLFERETPETWLLQAESSWDRWQVLGLFNWGENWSFGVKSPAERRSFLVDFNKLGLPADARRLVFDFWNEKYLGDFTGGFTTEIDPGDGLVLCLREPRPHPWFLAWNRQLTMGAVELPEVRWEENTLTLSGRQTAVAGFGYRLWFFCPRGFALDRAEADGAGLKVSDGGEVIMIEFTPATSVEMSWRLRFRRTDPTAGG